MGCCLYRYSEDGLPSIDFVLETAAAAVALYGVRGLVIDPYNELDHSRPSHMRETDYIGQLLGKLKGFAKVDSLNPGEV